MKRFLLFFVAALLFVACDNKFEDEGNTIQRVSTLPTLTAEFADEDTRTYVENNFYLRWHEGDLISAFVGNTRNSKYIFDGKTGDNSGKFEPVGSNSSGEVYDLNRNYALYPYDEEAMVDSGGSISYSLPAVQEYAEESFGKGANTMVAVTKSTDDTFLAFKNACGYLKIKLYGNATVESIELKGNNGEKIAGEASITATYGGVPTVAMAEDATESITLDCGDGVKLSTDAEKPTEFWVVVPAVEFSEGLTIVATDIYGATFEKSTNKKVTITRNEIKPMAALEAIFSNPTKPAYNEIWYTSSDGEIVEPYSGPDNDYADAITTFGANIVSNNYKDGKGVITFDGDVTTIGYRAFRGCTSLTSVTIPDSVTTIGYAAFADCDSLTSVTIPDSVTTIGNFAFNSCDSLTSATIPDSVTTIGAAAFRYCDSLTSVTIPDSVTTIGTEAFLNCESLTSVTIGDSVTTIGNLAFCYCDSLKEFKGKFASDDGRCLIVDGVLNSFANGCGATDYTIPDSVTTIGDWAFYKCYSLTSVTIPDSVTTIGDRAFYSCDSLTSVTIPNSVTTIEACAFCYCDSLKEFKGKFAADNGRCLIVDGVLNSFANGCGATDYTIPDSVTTIGDWAFYNCDSLTSVTIGDNVTTIGGYAFAYCDSLTSAYCKATTPPSLGSSAFYVNHSGRKIYVPRGCGEAYKSAHNWSDYAADIVEYDFETGEVVPEGQPKNEIWYTSSDGNIVEPYNGPDNDYADALTTFGANIVSNNYKDGKGVITFDGNVTTIGERAFWDCESLTSVTIPDSVTTIGAAAFRYCDSLTSVTIPDSVTTIGDAAFGGCRSLKEFKGKFVADNGRCLIVDGVLNSFSIGCGATEYTIPDSVTTIGYAAFAYCYSLTSVTIPDSVTTIGRSAFYECTSLTSVTIPDSVTTIGTEAFYSCSSLTSVTIPDSVTTIGKWAFENCYSLTSVTIPDSVKKIGDYAFKNCSNLQNITIGSGVTSFGLYVFSEVAGKLTINCNIPDRAFQDTDITSLVIGDNVTSIGVSAFKNCTKLTNLNIPDNVKTIDSNAFYGCSSLQNITIGSGVTSFGSNVFYGFAGKLVIKCNVSYTLFKGTDVTSVTIEGSASKIGDEAFANCSSLKNLTIENGVTEIESSAFSHCKLLTDVTIPNSVKTIGRNAFGNCSSLQNVIIGSGVTSFGSDVFYGFTGKLTINSNITKEVFQDTGITSLVIGDNVTSIGVSAFRNCTKLTNLNIPDNVKTIDSHAFRGCSNLQNVTIGNGIKSFGLYVFYGFAGKLTINSNIPKEAFKDTDITSLVIGNKVTSIGWSAFSGCTKLTDLNIPDNVKTIDSNAFYGCSSLQNITIGSGVTSFGSDVFYGFAGKLTINCDIPENTFKNYSITNLVIGNKVTSIGEYAFRGCTKLKSLNIPDNVKTIESYAFYGCDALTSTTIGKGVTSFGQSAFSNCTGTLTINCNIPDATRGISLSPFESGLFTSVVIGENVTKIGDGAFVRCEKLKDVTIGNSVTEIGYGAFEYCTSLTSITIPKNVKEIDRYAFVDCSKLTSVYCKSSTPPTAIMSSPSSYWKAFDNNASNRKIYVPSGSANKYKKANGWKEYEKYIE